ncbi:replication initiation protein A [Flavobacterium psychrophilum]|nr:replication initiation protein A [Flavobacterium psychrophilum]SNB44353.1 replication initiation protein A [Flavobacterium psychrophilum]
MRMELQKITSEKKIKQHNTITSGRTDYSACQLDVLFMLLACIEDTDDPKKRYNIRVKDIELITGRKWNYQQLLDSNEEMMSRVFKIEEEDGLRQIVLFSEIKYLERTGSFDMVINEPARPYFFELKNNYTLLELKSVLSCTSKHAKRLYSLACQWRGTGGHTYSIGELKEILGLKDPKGKEKEQYTELSALKRVVLDVAKKQINEHTDIVFDYELLKIRGRSFDTIKLFCGFEKPNLQLQLDIDFKGNIEKQKKNGELLRRIEYIERSGLSPEIAQLWALKYYKEFVAEKNNLLEGIANKKIKLTKDIPSYLVGVFKKKGWV